jgi:hypothetical protein
MSMKSSVASANLINIDNSSLQEESCIAPFLLWDSILLMIVFGGLVAGFGLRRFGRHFERTDHTKTYIRPHHFVYLFG